MTSSILLIDDHPAFRAGLRFILQELDGGVAIHEASSVQRALELIDAHQSHDLIVYDWILPDGGGLRGLLALLQLAPAIPVVVMSSVEDEAVRITALQVGARAYIPKSAEIAQIRSALQHMLMELQAAAVSRAATLHADRQALPASLASARPHAATNSLKALTGRQHDVLRLLARGLPNKEIAGLLGLAEPTVRDHVSDLMTALGARNRTHAVSIAMQHGLVA